MLLKRFLSFVFIFLVFCVFSVFLQEKVFAQENFDPFLKLVFIDESELPVLTPMRLRISLWDVADVRSEDFNPNGTINTSSSHYGGYSTNFVITPQQRYVQTELGGVYDLDLSLLSGFPEVLDSTNAFLQVEYKTPPGNPNNGYTLYDFVDDLPFQQVSRYQLLEDYLVLAPSSDPGTLFDTFVIDANDDAPSNVSLQFGSLLAESLSWDIANDYFILSDALVVDGNFNIQGSTFRLGYNDPSDADRDIVAVQGTDEDGVLRYSESADEWQISNDGGSFQPIATGVFGSQYLYAEDESVSTTTSTSFQQKLRLTTPALPSGTYRLGWSYQWNHDLASNDFEARIQYDDSLDLMVHHQEPKDSSGDFGSTGTDQQHQVSGFKHGFIDGGVHTIDFDFRTDDAGTESSVWNVRLEFWRVQ